MDNWVGALMNIRVGSRPDIAYETMILSTYMSNPRKAYYKGLRTCMRYLYHHPHLPIMYPRKPMKVNNVSNHSQVGVEEYKSNTKDTIGDTYYTSHDSDLSRDLRDRISVNSNIHMMNGVTIYWDSKKQSEVSEHSNGDEIRALYHGLKKKVFIRNFLKSIGFPCKVSNTTYEDN